MIFWRTKTNNYNTASTRYRAIYPAWFLFRKYGLDSHFVSGPTTRRMLRHAAPGTGTAMIFAKHFSVQDLALARVAKARGMRIVYDQCDNYFAKNFVSRIDNPAVVREALPLLDALVFPTAALRDVFLEHGFPADKCRVVPDAMIARDEELAAFDWAAGRSTSFRRTPLVPPRHGWKGYTPKPDDDVLPARAGQRLVWFGGIRSKFGRTGLDLFDEIVPVLNDIAARRPVELVLVTGQREPCARAMAGAQFPWHFVAWSVSACGAAVRSADACLLPAGNDAFTATKSANRVLLGAANGVPVVTSRHPSIAGFEDAFLLNDGPGGWAAAIEAALDRGRDPAVAGCVNARLEPAFGADAIAMAWRAILFGDGKAG